MSKYQIGKDVQDLQNRIEQLEKKLSSKSKCLGGKGLPPDRTGESTEKLANGTALRYKWAEWGRKDRGDCEWTYNRVRIYPDGRYRDEYRIYDHGTVVGDNSYTQIELRFSNGTSITDWSRWYGLSAGEEDKDVERGFQQVIDDKFDDIDMSKSLRHRNCG